MWQPVGYEIDAEERGYQRYSCKTEFEKSCLLTLFGFSLSLGSLSGFSLSFVNKLPVLIPYLRGRQAETGKPNSAGTWENTALFTFLSG